MTVFAPVLYLTVTVETTSDDADEVHIHPGGQGFWIARMLRHVEERPLLCGPVGGEPGQVIRGLLGQWGMDVSPVQISDWSMVSVQDRRSGDRVPVAESRAPQLVRHELDDAYGRLLEHALVSGVCVVTGQTEGPFPVEMYGRLGHDLAAGGVRVVADMHGPELEAFLDGGPIEILKLSDEDLEDDGLQGDLGARRGLEAIDGFMEKGAAAVVLSRQGRPALARFGSTILEARPPELAPADFRGAGDSMTAGLAAGVRRGMGPDGILRLGCAAGAANVTRRGLGSSSENLVPGLADRVEVRALTFVE